METDRAAGKHVAELFMLNGQLQLKLPDDPGISEGPTRFDVNLTQDQVEALVGAMPTEARDRILKLVDQHVADLDQIRAQSERELDEYKSRKADGARTRAAIDIARASG